MTPRRPSSSDGETTEAIAVLLANTGRPRRKLSLLEVGDWIEVARRELGSLAQVADTIGVSPEMLREFAAVRKLVPEVREMVARRDIDSVDVAHRLARLPDRDQVAVAHAFCARRLTRDDVRAIVPMRRAEPQTPVGDLIARLEASHDLREYLVEFVRPPNASADDIRARLVPVVGEASIRWLRLGGPVGVLALDEQGRRRLQEEAKRRRLTKRQLVDGLVNEARV
jgi:hypothetical protein